jgi:Putative Ig domain
MISVSALVRSTLLCTLAGTLVSLSSPASAASTTLVISGTPATSVVLGQEYSFQPKGTDSEDSRMKYDVSNKPSWATFNGTTGLLSGKPAGHVLGTTSGIVIRFTDQHGFVNLPAFSITVTAAAPPKPVVADVPPTISGTPIKTITVGSAYSFKPVAADANGDKLTYSIQDKPVWAAFSTSTGALTGMATAAEVGTYANIGISVSDGKESTSLPAFTVTVNQIATGNITVDWTPPTENVDGSVLTNLAGYRMHYGTSVNDMTHYVEMKNPGLTSYVVENLPAGTWYFGMFSYSTANIESAMSGVASATVL